MEIKINLTHQLVISSFVLSLALDNTYFIIIVCKILLFINNKNYFKLKGISVSNKLFFARLFNYFIEFNQLTRFF